MSDISSLRRGFLQRGAASLVTGLTAAAALLSKPAAASAACGGMSRERYLEYVQLFNANDPRFVDFYHEDVVFELGAREIKTRQGIRDFYADVKAHIKEKVEVTHFISDATGIAAELPTEFRVIKDWENGFFGRPLKVGEVMRVVSFGLYWVRDGKFSHIKSARYKQINDWRMEA